MKENKYTIWISLILSLIFLGMGCGKQVDNVPAEDLEEKRNVIITIDLEEDCGGFDKGNYAALCASSGKGKCVTGRLTVKDGTISVIDMLFQETFEGEETFSKEATSMVTGTNNTNEIAFSSFIVGKSSVGTHHWDSKPGAPCDIRIVTR